MITVHPLLWRATALLGALALWLIVAGLTACATAPEQQEQAALETLGWQLLADRRLSASNTTSCLDCHQPARGYTDGRTTATVGGLNTPPLWGLKERTAFGWFTPTVISLEEMSLRPLHDTAEMGPAGDTALTRLRDDATVVAAYRAAFPDAQELVTWEQTAAALAAAIRTITPPPSAYDRFVAGDRTALSAAAQRGEALFVEIGCRACHRPPSFATDSYHDVGVSSDRSRNNGRARVPTLRGIRHTAPYFHDGSAPSLESVVRAYERGGQEQSELLSPAIVPLQLSDQDVRDLVAFLESL